MLPAVSLGTARRLWLTMADAERRLGSGLRGRRFAAMKSQLGGALNGIIGLEQFERPGTQVVLYPPAYKSGDLAHPHSSATHQTGLSR